MLTGSLIPGNPPSGITAHISDWTQKQYVLKCSMAIETIVTTVQSCTCDLCGHEWLSLASLPPRSCTQCKSRAWNGSKPVGRPRSIPSNLGHLPAPTRVREVEEL